MNPSQEKPEDSAKFLGVIHHFLSTSKDDQSDAKPKSGRKAKKPARKSKKKPAK